METVIIADDHPVSLNGLSSFVTSLGYKVVGEFSNGITAYNGIVTIVPDFAIVDISMPGMHGLEILEKVRQRSKKQKIILYTMFDDMALFNKAQNLDVNGYILKEFALEELKTCLEYLRYKKQWFTPKLTQSLVHGKSEDGKSSVNLLTAAERKVLSLIAVHKSSKEIAELLFISEKTVENHRSNMIKKLGLQGHKNALHIYAVQHS